MRPLIETLLPVYVQASLTAYRPIDKQAVDVYSMLSGGHAH